MGRIRGTLATPIRKLTIYPNATHEVSTGMSKIERQ